LKFTSTLIALIFTASTAFGELLPGDPSIGAVATPDGRLPSNSIIDIVPHGSNIWFGTGQGLGQLHLSDGSWSEIRQAQGIGQGGVSALCITDSVIWAATAFSRKINDTYYPAGGGVGYSRDEGSTWTWMPQPIDSVDETRYNPTTTNVQNVTYDVALTDSAVWITSWGGGLRMLRYGSSEWELRTVDDSTFAPLNNLRHVVFSTVWDGQSLWVGSAGGVHRTDNNGQNWATYSYSPTSTSWISGNFVVALGVQKVGAKKLIWAATWRANKATEYYGVSVTEDDGLHWRVALSDSTLLPNSRYLIDDYGPLRAHNFGFQDSTVYVCADGGLWIGENYGQTWDFSVSPVEEISDLSTGERLSIPNFFSAASTGDSLWIGTDEGVALNDGSSWRIHRAYAPPGRNGEPLSYAYPSPFSPKRGDVTRLQFPLTAPTTVSFEIYDFAMEQVYKSANFRLPGGGAGDMAGYGAIQWNGLSSENKGIANGVYFYRVKADGATYWGKVMVID